VVRIVGGGVRERLLASFERILPPGQAALAPEIVHQGHGIEFDEVLGQISDRHPLAIGDLDHSAVRIDNPEDRPQKGCLARPVVAHETDPTAVGDRPVDLLEDLPVGEREADVSQVDHGLQLLVG
jgi:hypothetical protein